MFPLKCAVQTYAWGKPASEALVAALKNAEDSDYTVDLEAYYAELWMGTHPNGPSSIRRDGGFDAVDLKDWITKHPDSLGDLAEEGDIPFMFKVLSINKALSIQSHPDKDLAKMLHAAYPDRYKDPNHKPEIAIALSENFEAMCGFRPIEDILANIRKFPELNALLSTQALELLEQCERFPQAQKLVHKIALRELFTSYLHAQEELAVEQLDRLVARLKEELAGKDLSDPEALSDDTLLKNLIVRLSGQFPGDRGMMAPIFFNYLRLRRGESIFLPANEPHAYLSGEILECMASSDNVVRAGLTPKFIDRDTLCAMLTYRARLPKIRPGKVKAGDPWRQRYYTPVEEFEVALVDVPAGERYTLEAIPSPTFLLVLEDEEGEEGAGAHGRVPLRFGGTFFIPAGRAVVLAAASGEGGGALRVTLAHANLRLGERRASAAGA
ncbi:unnamed protein product, partial [Heterosigma akashiwo]